MARRGDVRWSPLVDALDMNTESTNTAAVAPRNLRVGLAVVLAVVGGAATAASFTQRVQHVASDATRFPAAQSLTVTIDDADLTLVSTTSGRLEVTRDARWSGPHPPPAPTLTNGVLRLRSCPTPWWLQIATYGGCDINYRVAVPAGQNVTVRSGNGGTTLSGTFGTVRVSAGNGDISTQDLAGDAFDLRSDNGDVRVAYGAGASQLVARSSNGDVRVEVGGGQFAVTAKSGNGDVNVEPQLVNGQSPRAIEAFSDNGDVSVRRRP